MVIEEKSKGRGPAAPKYKVARSPNLGRYLQAAKNLAPGEVILREGPVAVGPMASNVDCVCFACLRLLPKLGKAGQYYVCSKCKVAPLCTKACEEEPKHHTAEECEIFRSNTGVSGQNIAELMGVLLPLRLWLVRQKDEQLWEQIELMEAHMEERRNTAIWIDREANIINVMKALRLVPDNETTSIESLQRLCGILDVNSFELRSPGGLDGVFLRGVYIEASLMAHDCRGNTHLTVDDSFQLTVYASTPIQQNEPILFNYTSSLLGSTVRREHLREGKYFECECPLCRDPYEMQSHMSSILCPRCRKGYIGAQNPLVVNPFGKSSRWHCNMCKSSIGGGIVRATLNISKNLIEDTDDSDIKGLEVLMSKLSRSFHQNHALIILLKQKLLAGYRKEVAGINPPKKSIQRMMDMCKDIYNVLEIVEPGISRLKGIMLYEMHLPAVLLANRAYAAREITPSELALRLEEAAGLLKKSLTMLLLEPASTPEGKLAKRALQELKALNQNVADVKTIASSTTVQNTQNTRTPHKKRSHKNLDK